MKRILLILLIFSNVCVTFAQSVEFKASAPAQVIIGRPFQLSYSVNQRAKDLRAPEFTDFDYVAGPYTSQSSSTSFVNGKRTSSFQMTYTYTLLASKEGSFTIPPATIKVDGEQYTSNGVRITVLPADEPAQTNANRQSHTAGTTASQQNESQTISSENIFMRTLVSKTKVHEQEAILLTYKLYFAGVDVAQLTNNTRLPEFKGFLKQELEMGEIIPRQQFYTVPCFFHNVVEILLSILRSLKHYCVCRIVRKFAVSLMTSSIAILLLLRRFSLLVSPLMCRHYLPVNRLVFVAE